MAATPYELVTQIADAVSCDALLSNQQVEVEFYRHARDNWCDEINLTVTDTDTGESVRLNVAVSEIPSSRKVITDG